MTTRNFVALSGSAMSLQSTWNVLYYCRANSTKYWGHTIVEGEDSGGICRTPKQPRCWLWGAPDSRELMVPVLCLHPPLLMAPAKTKPTLATTAIPFAVSQGLACLSRCPIAHSAIQANRRFQDPICLESGKIPLRSSLPPFPHVKLTDAGHEMW